MFAGAVLGTLLLRRGLALPLIVGAVGVLVATVAYARRADVTTGASESPRRAWPHPTKVG